MSSARRHGLRSRVKRFSPIDKTHEDAELVFYRSVEASSKEERFTASVGENVLLRNGDKDAAPFIGQLEAVFQDKRTQKLFCEVRWFYRKEDTVLGTVAAASAGPTLPSVPPSTGRGKDTQQAPAYGLAWGLPKDFEDEVFESTHRDINVVESLVGKCNILTLPQYSRLTKAVKKAALTGTTNTSPRLSLANTFFCRKGYNPLRSRFVSLQQPSHSRFAIPRRSK